MQGGLELDERRPVRQHLQVGLLHLEAGDGFDGVQGRIDNAPEFYGAGKFYPLSYLISRDGRVEQRWSGRPRETWLQAQVAQALHDGTASVAWTDHR